MNRNRKVLPLREAYPFGEQQGMKSELDAIRDMAIKWDRSYTSSVRRGCAIALFQQKGVFETFKETHWPEGNADKGTMTAFYLRLKGEYEGHQPGRA
jgi:hypothetical protein